jgi:hypothetical protein
MHHEFHRPRRLVLRDGGRERCEQQRCGEQMFRHGDPSNLFVVMPAPGSALRAVRVQAPAGIQYAVSSR